MSDGAEVKIRVKDENVQGAEKVAGGIGKIVNNAKSAVPALLLLNQTFGQSDGIISKAIRSISGVASALAAFGPAGGIVAAAKAGMDMVAGYFIEKAEKMLEKAKEFGAAMTKRLDKLKEMRLTHLANDLERVSEAAAKAERRLAAAAETDAKFRATSMAAADAREEGELAGMRHAMAADVAAAEDGDAGRVAAAWRLKIAEREAEIRNAAADREREAAKERLDYEEKRLALAEKNAQKLQEAANKAAEKFEEAFNTSSETDPQWVAKMKRLSESATKAARAAWEDVDRRRGAIDAARADEDVAETRRQNGVNAAFDARDEAAWSYDRAEIEHARAIEAEARKEALKDELEQEERDRLSMERRISDERKRMERQLGDLRADEAAAGLRLAAAQAASARAWGWYRDKSSLQAQLDEEKANAAAEKQFGKDFERLKSFRKDWRTAQGLSLDDEAVRRVGLAREEEKAAEEWAKVTAESSRKAVAALESILRMMEE